MIDNFFFATAEVEIDMICHIDKGRSIWFCVEFNCNFFFIIVDIIIKVADSCNDTKLTKDNYKWACSLNTDKREEK